MNHKQFKSARHALGLTQIALAQALGKTSTAISRYECGCNIPKTTELAMAYLKIVHVAKNRTIGL